MKILKLMCGGAVLAALAVNAGCSGTAQDQAVAAQPSEQSSSPARAKAPVTPQRHMVTVPAGTVLTLALDTTLNSKTTQTGDSFTATVVEAIVLENREVIPAGSKIEGRVTESVPAKRGSGNAKLALSFDKLRLESGYRTDIAGSFREVTASKKGRDTAIIGGSAAGGALLGRILGKDTRGTVIGAIVGGGIGTAVVMSKEGLQVNIPTDTPFEIRLEESVQVPHEAPHA